MLPIMSSCYKFLLVSIISCSLIVIVLRDNTLTSASCRCDPNVCDIYDNVKNEIISINTTKCYNEFALYDYDDNTFVNKSLPVYMAIICINIILCVYAAVSIIMTIFNMIVCSSQPVERNVEENNIPRRRSARIKNLNTTQIISISNR